MEPGHASAPRQRNRAECTGHRCDDDLPAAWRPRDRGALMAMRWEDEPWLKFYTRETPTTASWAWQAHAVWPQIMKRLDGAGMLHLGRRGVIALANLIRYPLE